MNVAVVGLGDATRLLKVFEVDGQALGARMRTGPEGSC